MARREVEREVITAADVGHLQVIGDGLTADEFERRKAAGEFPPHAVLEHGRVIVSGVAAMVGHGALGPGTGLARYLEEAYQEAVKLALSDGYSMDDAAVIRQYIQWARSVVLRQAGRTVEASPRPQPKVSATS